MCLNALESCHSVSSWDRSSNFGAFGIRWWGSPGQILLSDEFWSLRLALRNTALVDRTHRIGFGMVELFRQIDEDLGGSISWDTTQLSCLLQKCHCTFLPFFVGLLLGCSSTRRCAKEHFSPNLHPSSVLYNKQSGECHFSTRGIRTSTFNMILAWQTRNSPRRTSTCWTFGSLWIFHILWVRRRFWSRSWRCRSYCTLIAIVPAFVFFRTLSPCPLWTRRCSLWFLTKVFDWILPFLASKSRDLKFCSIPLFTIVVSLR